MCFFWDRLKTRSWVWVWGRPLGKWFVGLLLAYTPAPSPGQSQTSHAGNLCRMFSPEAMESSKPSCLAGVLNCRVGKIDKEDLTKGKARGS